MANISVTGNRAYFNEDAEFFKDVYIYGTLYYDFESYPGVLKFRDVSIKNLTVSGISNFNGASTFSGNIIPSVTDTYDLGSENLRWNNIYVKNINGIIISSASSITVTNDNNTNQTRYINFASTDTNSGVTSIFVDSSLTYNPASNVLGINTNNLTNPNLVGTANSAKGLYISNGMILMDNLLTGNHYIGTNYNAVMAGPVMVDGIITIDGNWSVV